MKKKKKKKKKSYYSHSRAKSLFTCDLLRPTRACCKLEIEAHPRKSIGAIPPQEPRFGVHPGLCPLTEWDMIRAPKQILFIELEFNINTNNQHRRLTGSRLNNNALQSLVFVCHWKAWQEGKTHVTEWIKLRRNSLDYQRLSPERRSVTAPSLFPGGVPRNNPGESGEQKKNK